MARELSGVWPSRARVARGKSDEDDSRTRPEMLTSSLITNLLKAIGRAAARLPISTRICDAVTLAAAVWTIACHAAVATGGSLRAALLNFTVLAAVAAGVVLFVLRARRGLPRSERLAQPPLPPVAVSSWLREPDSVTRALGGLLGIGALGLYLATGSVLHLWWAALGVLVFALVTGARGQLQPPPGATPQCGGRPEAGR